MDSNTVTLFLYFVLMSLISVGGVGAILPDVQRYVVEEQQWMSARQFADTYALSQISPGPNMMYVTLVGWHVDGWAGAIAATVAMVLPTALVSLAIVRFNALGVHTVPGRAIRGGLAPITLGLILASGWVLVSSVNHDWRGYALTVLTMVVMLRTKWNPVWLIGAGAVAGVTGLV